MAKADKKGKIAVAADLTTKVNATTLKWMSSAVGTKDADKYYLVGSQSQVLGAETAAPHTQHKVYTVAVVPRVAKKTELSKVAKASGSSSTMLSYDVCLTSKVATKADCEAKPAKKVAFNQSSFFLQVVSEANVSKVAYESVL